ncbi:MAG: translocation/assembly module TamB domain-containing protein, partial [Methyloprofundus sp.]|nr:translocation/assembly module TamB domain-containing protein [Methyloprofundus sp.]
YALDANIKIRLGENVSLEGFGLKTLLQGQLQAVQKNNKLKLFNALSSVKGTYQAYGQDLEIEKGRLLFNGDMENPGVNILASRRASDWEDKTIAYLRMTGTLKNPVTTVYTEPALSESEALAYLLTGGSLGESDSSNAALLAAAAMGLGRDYIDALMGVIGIDEFDMKSTSVGQNSMVIGKRISSDLYARYIMDVLTSEMQFAVIYKLTKNISIETRAGYTHSSDIRYNIEFD